MTSSACVDTVIPHNTGTRVALGSKQAGGLPYRRQTVNQSLNRSINLEATRIQLMIMHSSKGTRVKHLVQPASCLLCHGRHAEQATAAGLHAAHTVSAPQHVCKRTVSQLRADRARARRWTACPASKARANTPCQPNPAQPMAPFTKPHPHGRGHAHACHNRGRGEGAVHLQQHQLCNQHLGHPGYDSSWQAKLRGMRAQPPYACTCKLCTHRHSLKTSVGDRRLCPQVPSHTYWWAQRLARQRAVMRACRSTQLGALVNHRLETDRLCRPDQTPQTTHSQRALLRLVYSAPPDHRRSKQLGSFHRCGARSTQGCWIPLLLTPDPVCPALELETLHHQLHTVRHTRIQHTHTLTACQQRSTHGSVATARKVVDCCPLDTPAQHLAKVLHVSSMPALACEWHASVTAD